MTENGQFCGQKVHPWWSEYKPLKPKQKFAMSDRKWTILRTKSASLVVRIQTTLKSAFFLV
jgi:hypothetical protein